MAIKKGFDLSKFNTGSQNFLNKKAEDSDADTVKKEPKKKKSEKVGRPMTTDEPLDQKITINLSKTEIAKLKLRAGQIPSASFLRSILKDNKII
jgi:hypothetical protein